MILPFSTQINSKPTYFVEKIHSGLLQNDLLQGFDLGSDHNFDLDKLCSCEPKLHTIREDKTNRWKAGNKIDFFINCRQPNMFRFAPVLPVVSVQKIEILYDKAFGKSIQPDVIIDGVRLHPMKLDELAQNDGFDTVEDFFAYFNEDFTGKLIHWTDKRY